MSAANSSSYCITAHLELLYHLGVDKSLARQVIRDYETAGVPELQLARRQAKDY